MLDFSWNPTKPYRTHLPIEPVTYTTVFVVDTHWDFFIFDSEKLMQL